mmetsp:Transcript_70931/g.162645  ORF Transcript_70931/g.162645 Transcript_70931/m.162645 type:complete len:122 (-) Transcript_70931:23-388(-)
MGISEHHGLVAVVVVLISAVSSVCIGGLAQHDFVAVDCVVLLKAEFDRGGENWKGTPALSSCRSRFVEDDDWKAVRPRCSIFSEWVLCVVTLGLARALWLWSKIGTGVWPREGRADGSWEG